MAATSALSPPDAERRRFALARVPGLSEAPEIARQARTAWGVEPEARLDLDRVCERLGIEVETADLEVPRGGSQGFLIPRANGFLIEVDPEPRSGWGAVAPALRPQLERHRKRFLIAHELTHTLFYANNPGGPLRIVSDSVEQEAFCDELARALLVPAEAAAALSFRPESAIELQRRFDVSLQVALRGLVAAHADAGAAWLLLRRRDQTKVQWSSASRRLTAHVLRGLRELASHAYLGHRAEANLTAPSDRAIAVYLPQREQVIVTVGPQAAPSAAP